MKKAISIVCLVAVLASAAAINQSNAAGPALTGKMTQLQYLIGSWTCQTKLPAMGKEPARTEKGTISFEIEPGNTVGYDVSGSKFSAAGYLGYQQATKLWWSSSADTLGEVTFESGASGYGNVNVMTGMTFYAGKHTSSRDTITKTSETKYEDLYEVEESGKWTLGSDSVCAKTSNTPS